MTTFHSQSSDHGPQRYDLLAFVLFEFRSLAIRRLRILAEWAVLEWVDLAECRDGTPPSATVCGRCPVADQCLAAAIATDDPHEWRGGVDRATRERIWAQMEQTYRQVRDAELITEVDLKSLKSLRGGPRRSELRVAPDSSSRPHGA